MTINGIVVFCSRSSIIICSCPASIAFDFYQSISKVFILNKNTINDAFGSSSRSLWSGAVMSHKIHQCSANDVMKILLQLSLCRSKVSFDKSPALILWANVVSSMILKLKLFFEKTIFRQRLRNHQYSSTSFRFELDHTEVISNARRIYILGTSKQLKWGMAFST